MNIPPLWEMPLDVDLDGMLKEAPDGSVAIRYIGSARRQLNGKYRVLAVLHGHALAVVEVTIRFQEGGTSDGE